MENKVAEGISLENKLLDEKIVQKKAGRPLFKQALSAVRKEVDTNKLKIKSNQTLQDKIKSSQNVYDDMSSGEQQKLTKMGVELRKTKKIQKMQKNISQIGQKGQRQWKHDKYRVQKPTQKPIQAVSSSNWIIYFPNKQSYNKVYETVKSQRAFIEQIDQKHIKLSRQSAFNACKSLLNKSEIEFSDKKQLIAKATVDQNKQSIFNRLK